MRKHPRRAGVWVAWALIVLLLGSNGLMASWLVLLLEWQNIPPAELPVAQAIIILGGDTKPDYSAKQTVDLSKAGPRLLFAAQLYREGKAPLVIASGGRIDWLSNAQPESADMAAILPELGVPRSAIIQDPNSLNTYQNAVNVRQILKTQQIRRVLLVTSAIHMPRALLIFRNQGIEAIAAPTDFMVTKPAFQALNSSPQAILLNLLPDVDRLQMTTRAVKEYIGIVIYRLKGWL